MTTARRIIVFGGHGRVARLVTARLAQAGDLVTSVIRNSDHAEQVAGPGIDVVLRDIEALTAADFAALIGGHDAVIWSAGAGGGNPERTFRVDRDGAVLSVQGSLMAGVDRYVMVSWSGSRLEHGFDPTDSFYPYAQAKAIADSVVRDSALHWTIVAPSLLTDEVGTGAIASAASAGSVSRDDVANVVVQCLGHDDSIRQTIRFDNGTTPIAEYLQALP